MRKYLVLTFIAILALAISGCAPFTPAPPTKAILKGQVLVPQGAVRQVGGQALPGATVNVIDPVTGDIVATTTTDANGNYQVEVPPGGPYIIEAVKDSIKVLDVSPQVEVGQTYDLEVANATSTAVALIFQAKVEAGEDPAEINLDEIKEDPKIGNLIEAIEEALAAGEDPTTAPEVTQVVEVIVNPPAPTPKPTASPTPTPDTTRPTLKSLTAYPKDGAPIVAVETGDGKWTLEWTVGETVTKIEAIASEPVRLVEGANAVVRMSGEGTAPDTNESESIDAVYGTIALDPSDASYSKKLIITPNEHNETAGLVGEFTFTVDAGVIKDYAGNTNAEVTVTLEVEAKVVNVTQGKWYYTIQDAITAAAPGDTILVGAGEYKENPTITTTAINLTGIEDALLIGTLSINGVSGIVIEGINFKVASSRSDSIVLSNVNNITIKNCEFDGGGFFLDGGRAIQMNSSNNGILIDNCIFRDGYYVTVQGHVNNLTVKNSSIENCKSGINLQVGNNLVVANTDISVKAQGINNDTYCVRFADNSTSSSGLTINNGTFTVDKAGFVAGEGIYHIPIIIRSKATGALNVSNVTINGTIVNKSSDNLSNTLAGHNVALIDENGLRVE